MRTFVSTNTHSPQSSAQHTATDVTVRGCMQYCCCRASWYNDVKVAGATCSSRFINATAHDARSCCCCCGRA